MLDKQLEALLGQARAAGLPDLCDLPVEAARAVYRQLMAGAGGPSEPVDVEALSIPGVYPGTMLPARRYATRGSEALPVVVWYHGGGYMLGDLEGYDGVCRQLAVDAHALVLAVDYRLAPEHPFPAAFDDAWAALQWVASEAGAAALGARADTSRLAVAGDSAGAALALAVSLQARDAGGPHLSFQALAYPPASALVDGDFPSRQRHAAGPTLTLRTMDHFNRSFVARSTVPPDHRVTPLAAPSLAGLPDTLVQLAALDPLRDEGLALAERLSAEGTAVSLVEYHGLAHGYLGQGGVVRAARWAQREFGQCLRDALHVGNQ